MLSRAHTDHWYWNNFTLVWLCRPAYCTVKQELKKEPLQIQDFGISLSWNDACYQIDINAPYVCWNMSQAMIPFVSLVRGLSNCFPLGPWSPSIVLFSCFAPPTTAGPRPKIMVGLLCGHVSRRTVLSEGWGHLDQSSHRSLKRSNLDCNSALLC